MNKTKIDWCDMSWNPVTGCLHGCPYCYARTMAHRFGNKFENYGNSPKVLDKPWTSNGPCEDDWRVNPYPYGFAPTFHRYRLEEPEREKRPKNIFAVSMGDLFGSWVPYEWIRDIFAECERAPWHRYLFLTKNPNGIDKFMDGDSGEERGYEESIEFFAPFWFGTTVTCAADIERANILTNLREGHRFLSIEPLLGPVNLNFEKDRCPECGSDEIYEDNPRTRGDASALYCDDCGWEGNNRSELKPSIEWVIVGAETGKRNGRIIPQRSWIKDIVNQCRASGVSIFMKNSLSGIWGEPLIQEFPWEAHDD